MRYAPAARSFLAAGVVLTAVRAVGVIALTYGLATAVAPQETGSVFESLFVAFIGLTISAIAQWAIDAWAVWAGNRVTVDLRMRALSAFRSEPSQHSTEIATLLTTGVDAVSRYVVSFLPAVVAALVFTPIIVGAITSIDPLSGLAVAVTIPLIPLFMVLIGRTTQATQSAQWLALSALSKGFNEVVSGLSTLMLFGRERRQGPRIREVTEGYRKSTMKVLRLSFLSSFALEIGASLSVAVVAVSIGIRLINGEISLDTGLWVLILVPEAFTAVRLVGARFHASADGLTVANEVFCLIESPVKSRHRSGGSRELIFESVSVPGRLAATSGRARQGTITVVVGASGSGKSTLLDIIRGELDASGSVELDGKQVALDDCSLVPQSTILIGRLVSDAISLGSREKADPAHLATAMSIANVDFGVARSVSELSGGEAQRVAIARAVFRALSAHTPVLILDEPTSALDDENERSVIAGLREMAQRGYIVVVASHRPAVVDAADVIVEVSR